MPIYEHACETCGPFEERRDVDRAGEPAPCPGCGQPAPRTFGLAVGSTGLTPAGRALRERAGAGEPRTETRRIGEASAAHGGHGRPWMIGH